MRLRQVDRSRNIFFYASSWANELHALPFSSPAAAREDVTVEVQAVSNLRRMGGGARLVTEDEVLRADGNYVVLGDPDAGRTTMLRRLALRVMGGDEREEPDE